MDAEKLKIYHEFFGILILQNYNKKIFTNFEKSEQPDFVDTLNSRGIEMTLLTVNDSKRLDSAFYKLNISSSIKEKDKAKALIESLGYSLDCVCGKNRLYGGGAFNGCENQFKKLLEKKLSKINIYKANLEKVDLFIECDCLCYNDLSFFKKWIKDIETNISTSFDNYYFYFNKVRKLYRIDRNKTILLYSFDAKNELDLKCKSKNMCI